MNSQARGKQWTALWWAVGIVIMTIAMTANHAPPDVQAETLQNVNYTYDNVGNIEALTDPVNGSQQFIYDHLDRLTQATGPYGVNGANTSFTYEYDQIGNLTKNTQLSATTYGYPPSGASSVRPHAVTTAGANTYTYDANGNMTGGAGRTYTWTADNMPLTIVQGSTTTSFVYDGDGGRVKKTVGSTTIRYISKLYECEVVSSNASCSRYVWAGDTRIAVVPDSATAQNCNPACYYHADHLGSSSVITGPTGMLVERMTYYPYGEVKSDSPGTPVNVPYKYTDQELDGSTGLYDYGARHYDPVLGRFVSADPIVPDPADPQEFNRYSYARNNPLRYTDPTGHHSVESVATYSYAILAFTDWNSDGFLSAQDIHELYGSPFGTPTGNITIEQRDVLLGWMHGISNGLHVDGILPIVFPAGGNRAADFFNELAKFRPNSPQWSAVNGFAGDAISAAFGIDDLVEVLVGGGVGNAVRFGAGKLAAKTVATSPNRIYSAKELIKRAGEPGPYHNFPESFNQLIFSQGTRTVTPNFYNIARPGLSNNTVMYRLPGSVNSSNGMFEIAVRPSVSGNTEVIMHRFFNPKP
jgi:RHS repeat-associated protein